MVDIKPVFVGAFFSLAIMFLFMLLSVFRYAQKDPTSIICNSKNPSLIATEKTSKPLPVIFPPNCTDDERRLMEERFPVGRSSELTKCPDATWWDDYLYDEFFSTEYIPVPLEGEPPSYVHKNVKLRPLVSIFCGCNKGDDAVLTLRKLTGDRRVDTAQFTRIMANESKVGLFGRACPAPSLFHPLVNDQQEHPFVRHSNINGNTANAHVYCIEAMPLTAQILKASVDRCAWNDSFTVSHAAMGKQDGTIDFPTPDLRGVGVENYGIADCANKRNDSQCETVPLYSLDTYVRQFVLPKNNAVAQDDDWVIDFLSVDVEGYDWDVLGLGGANKTLKHVRYLEFEYHYADTWSKYQLEDAVRFLKEYDFVCYYAGVGRLWRVTDCFLPYMNDHRWSNVACVNVRLQPRLATRMEMLFKKELYGTF